MAKKTLVRERAGDGFLKVAAEAIGSTLGQLAKKAGVVSAPPPSAPVKKRAALKKKTAVRKEAALPAMKKTK